MNKSNIEYKLSPSWRVTQLGTRIMINGGADALYEIETDSNEKSFFIQLKTNESFKRKDVPETERPYFEQLLLAEIIKPVVKPRQNLKVAIMGDETDLKIKLPISMKIVKITEKPDIVIIIRWQSKLENMANYILKPEFRGLPYIFFDTAYHHTLSIGPLVFPGETACLGCLYGRVAVRWGDAKPPETPSVIKDHDELISLSIIDELKRFMKGDTSLVGKTVAWDFTQRSMTTETLLKVAVCPSCDVNYKFMNNKL